MWSRVRGGTRKHGSKPCAAGSVTWLSEMLPPSWNCFMALAAAAFSDMMETVASCAQAGWWVWGGGLCLRAKVLRAMAGTDGVMIRCASNPDPIRAVRCRGRPGGAEHRCSLPPCSRGYPNPILAPCTHISGPHALQLRDHIVAHDPRALSLGAQAAAHAHRRAQRGGGQDGHQEEEGESARRHDSVRPGDGAPAGWRAGFVAREGRWGRLGGAGGRREEQLSLQGAWPAQVTAPWRQRAERAAGFRPRFFRPFSAQISSRPMGPL